MGPYKSDLDCKLFCLPDVDVLMWSAGIVVLTHRLQDKAHVWCDQAAEDACSSLTPDPTHTFFMCPCCPTLYFAFAFRIMIRLTHCVFCYFIIYIFNISYFTDLYYFKEDKYPDIRKNNANLLN
jgi:hypothetical protein